MIKNRNLIVAVFASLLLAIVLIGCQNPDSETGHTAKTESLAKTLQLEKDADAAEGGCPHSKTKAKDFDCPHSKSAAGEKGCADCPNKDNCTFKKDGKKCENCPYKKDCACKDKGKSCENCPHKKDGKSCENCPNKKDCACKDKGKDCENCPHKKDGKGCCGNCPKAKAAGKEAAEKAGSTASLDVPPDKVIVTYFHGGRRCGTCKKLESQAQLAVQNGFTEELAAGLIEWRVINTDLDENKHYKDEYQLYSKALILSAFKGDKEIGWKNLDKIWEHVSNPEQYQDYVQDGIKEFMGAS